MCCPTQSVVVHKGLSRPAASTCFSAAYASNTSPDPIWPRSTAAMRPGREDPKTLIPTTRYEPSKQERRHTGERPYRTNPSMGMQGCIQGLLPNSFFNVRIVTNEWTEMKNLGDFASPYPHHCVKATHFLRLHPGISTGRMYT